MKKEDMLKIESVPTLDALRELAAPFPDVDPRALEAYLHVLKYASVLIDALDKHYARYGLSRGRFVVLLILFHENGSGLPPAEIAARIGVSPATMTGLVDGLENEGLVQRRKHPGDRRKIRVCLTPRARKRLKTILPDHFNRVTALTSDLSAAERRTLISLLDKVSARAAALPAPDLKR